MPIPETPYTREEAYLNAIATGDSGNIPETPYTREEMYLDAIARNGGGGGGSSTLSGLTDVDISNPSNGQTLVYNSTSGKWENGAGGGGVLALHVNMDTGQADKTVREIMAAAENNVVMIASDERLETNEIVYYQLQYVSDHEQGYGYNYVLHFRAATTEATFGANNLDDYPVWY